MNVFAVSFISAFTTTNTILQNNKQAEKVESKPISFGYNSPLKKLWRQGKMPSVIKGFYGDTLNQSNLSLEHLKPHSKGGKTCLSNLVLASKEKNQARSNFPIKQFFDKEKAIEYLNQFINIKLKDFNGNSYIKGIVKTLRDQGIDI
jgi:hypothetical protein